MSLSQFNKKLAKADESGLIDWKEIARKTPCAYTAMRNYVNGKMPRSKYRKLAPKIVKHLNAQIDRNMKKYSSLKISNYA